MITDAKQLITTLANTPAILSAFIKSIPPEALKIIRKKGSWSIHKHVCHLAETQSILYQRLIKFKNEEHPVITPFFPDDDHDSFETQSTDDSVKTFTQLRQKQLDTIESYTDTDWKKEGTHDEYLHYNLHILIRHILMHDYLHMYRIEETWLTRDEYI